MNEPDVSIVVPTYKEAENLRPLVEGVMAAMHASPWSAEMIIVDDDSGDGSAELIGQLAQRHPVRIVVRTQDRGLSSAVIRGFREAAGRILVCMDADLSHPPGALPELIRPVAEGRADFCLGSRYVPGGSTSSDWGLFRWLNSWVARLLARPLTNVRDPMAGLFCLRRESFEQADTLNPIGYKIGLELIIKARCRRVREIPIAFVDRAAGRSKLTLSEQWRYLVHLKRLYLYRWPIGARLAPALAVLLIAAAIVSLWAM
jgi:dolichol-phosphate mannosyltransferase